MDMHTATMVSEIRFLFNECDFDCSFVNFRLAHAPSAPYAPAPAPYATAPAPYAPAPASYAPAPYAPALFHPKKHFAGQLNCQQI